MHAYKKIEEIPQQNLYSVTNKFIQNYSIMLLHIILAHTKTIIVYTIMDFKKYN